MRINLPRRGLLAGTAAAVLALTACGVDTAGGGDSSSSSGGTFSGQTLTVTAFAGSWGELFKTSFVEPFERETGAKVNLVFGASADWLTKLRAANGSNPPFDVLAFTPDASRPAAGGSLIEKLDTGKVDRWSELDKVLVEKAGVDGTAYGVPLTTGSTGLMYRTDKVKTPPTDWRDIFKKEYCGHVALPPLTYNPGLEFFSALVTSSGGSLSNPADVDKAFKELEQLKGCVSTYPANGANVQTTIENGEAWIAPYWDGRAFAIAAGGSPVGYTYPTSGAVGALTSYYIAAGTTKSDLAYKFLGYLTDPANQKKFGEGNWYAASNDTTTYSPEFDARIKHGPEVYAKFNWVDYTVATPNLNTWQQRWNEIFK